MITKITSKQNERIKYFNQLKDSSFRNKENLFMVEGFHLVDMALERGCVKTLISLSPYKEELNDIEQIIVTEEILEKLSSTKTPQGIIAICKMDPFINEVLGDKVLYLDDIQDPGNLGTILRTIDSVGLKQVIVSKETADAYNPKVVRSTMGAILRIKIIETDDLVKTLKEAKKNKFKIVATSLDTNNSIYDIDYKKKVIVIGNEANGVSKEIQELADNKVKIPMLGKTESLNASVATGIMLYEYVRQKIGK